MMKSSNTCPSGGSFISPHTQLSVMRQMFLILFLIYLLLIPKLSCQQSVLEEFPMSFSISEGARIGSLVGVIESVENKLSPPYIRWINNQSDNTTMASFLVDLLSGRITVREKLDREEKDKHTIVIEASSLPTKLVIVEITVLDINDESPAFQNPSVTKDISESAPENAKISLGKVRDADLGENSTKTVEIISGNEDGAFVLQVRDNSNVDKILDLVVTAQQLDYETTNEYFLVIRATDGGGRHSDMSVTIIILDQNDNTPVFNASKYSKRIAENVAIDTSVIKVEATDIDSGENSRITYSIARDSDPEEYFVIDPKNGLITVNKPLDFETKSEFLLTLEARDNGDPHQRGTAVLEIFVENINEQPANISLTFEPEFKNGHVPEDVQVDVLIATFTVHHPEIETKPSATRQLYGDKGDFKLRVVDSQIGLYVKKKLDRETTPHYELTVVVTDVGTPPLRANKEFKVIVDDINDNWPVFDNPGGRYTVDLEETVEVGKEVVKVSALDSDVDANGRITYHIQDATSHLEWFAIDSATGVIVTKATVDCELDPQPMLTVVARDGGDPPKMATAQVVINIRDVNDNQPEFDTSFYSFTVAENRRVGDCIITVSCFFTF